jgi:flagellar motor switch protein FliM
MIYSPDDAPQDIENHNYIEAEIETGRFRWMDVVLHRWANQLESTLFDQLHSVFEIIPDHARWERFGKVLENLHEQPIYIFETEGRGKGLLILDNLMANACIERDPDTIEQLAPLEVDDLTSETQKELFDIVSQIMHDFEACWTRIGEVQVHLKRITTHPMRAKVMLPFERCLLGTLHFRMGAFESTLTICLPYAALHPLLSKLDEKKVIAPESMDHYHDEIEEYFQDMLMEARYSVTAELGTVALKGSANESLLYEGKILPLNTPYPNKVIVRINDHPMLLGDAGNSNDKFCVQISEQFDEQKQTTQSSQKTFRNLEWKPRL